MPASWLNPSSDGADLGLEAFPTFLLQRAVTLCQRNQMRPLLTRHDFALPEYRVLAFLNHFGKVTSTDVRERSSMDKAQISRAVDSLVERGLVARESDPNHGKRYWLQITKAGQKAFDQSMVTVRQMQADILAALSPDERKGFYSALTKICELAKEAASERT